MARRSPFDVPLSSEWLETLGLVLAREVRGALDARSGMERQVDYWHRLYEQARTRTSAPWPDAADLTSHLASEKVDALHARLMRTIWTEPVWTVDGWGESAKRAPFVEEFHQWKAEEERLQGVLDRWTLLSLVEPRGLLEVSEGSEIRPVRKTIRAKVRINDRGGPIFDERGRPELEQSGDGGYQEAGENDIAAEVTVDDWRPIRSGPTYRILPYRDSLVLPEHARDKDEIWGYGKRLWRTAAVLRRRAEEGVYDLAMVERIALRTSDRETDQAMSRSGHVVAPEATWTAEKELWELIVLLDLNLVAEEHGLPRVAGRGYRGARWYLVTLHEPTGTLLRIQHDDIERSRFVLLNLFPRGDRAAVGYSFVGHKLLTLLEEHTAWRNMAADRAAMVAQAPVKRLMGALWDPVEQPWGPRSVIDVREMNEIEPVSVPELSGSIFQHIQYVERAAERVAGVNDIAMGQTTPEARTLGEIQMVTEQSFVRMDLVVRRFQEAMEELGQIRHAIWKRVLAENPDGIEVSDSMMQALEGRGVSIDQYLPGGRAMAGLLEGAFRFKPRGSVETADPNRLRMDFAQALQALPRLFQLAPPLQAAFMNPAAARELLRHFFRVFRLPAGQAVLGSAANDLGAAIGTDVIGAGPMQVMGGLISPPIAAGSDALAGVDTRGATGASLAG